MTIPSEVIERVAIWDAAAIKYMAIGFGLLALSILSSASVTVFTEQLSKVSIKVLLAFYFKKIKANAAFYAAIISETIVIIIFFQDMVGYLWLNAIGCTLVIGISHILSMILTEKDEKYAEPLNPMLFVKNNPSQFIWQSRRDGFNHFYLYNSNGSLIKHLTKGAWEVKDNAGFDDKGENLFFHAAEQSPINQDFYSVNLKSGKMTKLTQDNGYHTAILSQKADYFIDVYTSCYTPREF